MKQGKWFLALLAGVLVLAVFGGMEPTFSQAKYPARAITVLVPYSTGGTLDVVSRMNAAYLTEKLGLQVNVVNKPGGNTVPATLEVVTAAPDGYTLLAESSASCSMLTLMKDLPFKIDNRTYLFAWTSAPMLLLVPASTPWKTLNDVAEAVKRDPGNFAWISGGSTSVPAYVMRQFFLRIGVDVLKTREVMAKGGGEQITQVAGGHVKLTSLAPASSLPAIKAGTVRALAITSRERSAMLPDVPTTRELGYPEVDFQVWAGLSGPPRLPAEIVEFWDQTMRKALADPPFVSRFQKVAIPLIYRNSGETRELVSKEIGEIKKLWGGK